MQWWHAVVTVCCHAPPATVSVDRSSAGSSVPAGAPDVSAAGRQEPSDPIGRLLGPVPPLAAVGFPLLLVVLVVVFLSLQGRIDRRDPKLALAPIGAEHVEFV